jgi:hypothetical protein
MCRPPPTRQAAFGTQIKTLKLHVYGRPETPKPAEPVHTGSKGRSSVTSPPTPQQEAGTSSPSSTSNGLARAIRSISPHTKNRAFGSAYIIITLMVILPPAYLAASGGTPKVLGLPFSVFYMLLNGALAVLLIVTLWFVEAIRGEHEMFHVDPAAEERNHEQ